MHNLGIDTTNFYKFITTLSLISTIYFLSFDTLILEPHNEKLTELNIQEAELAAEIGYLKGVSSDLYEIVKDSIKNGHIDYFFYSKKDTSEYIKYYSNYKLTNNTKLIVDKLNLVNKDYAKSLFKSNTIDKTQAANEKNYLRREITSWIFGVISFIIFILSLLIWYLNKSKIDK